MTTEPKEVAKHKRAHSVKQARVMVILPRGITSADDATCKVTFSPTFAPKRLEVGASSIQAYIAGGIALLVTAIYTLFLKLPARYNLFYNGH